MPVLLGLEVVALSAVAARLPAVRATARETASYAYDTVFGSSDATTQVAPSAEDRVIRSQLQPAPNPVLLPELKADPEAAACSPLRIKEVLEQLANAVPRRYGGDVGGVWHLLFSTATDGTSLSHMLRIASGDAAYLIVVRDVEGKVFGAFCPELRETAHGHPSSGGHLGIAAVGAALQHGSDGVLSCGGCHAASSSAAAGGSSAGSSRDGATAATSGGSAFYGSGETFLYALADLSLPQLPERQLSSPSPSGASRSRTVTYTYRWARDDGNEQFCRADADGLYIGSGGIGGVGLRLDNELRAGVSGQCATFDNAPLPMVASPLASVARLDADMAAAAAAAAAAASDPASPTSQRRHPTLTTPPAAEAPSRLPPSGPSTGDLLPLGSAVRFDISTLEVWALDAHHCRGLPACKKHSRVPMHEPLVSTPMSAGAGAGAGGTSAVEVI